MILKLPPELKSMRRIEKYGISRFLLTGFSGMIKIFIHGKDYQEKDRAREDYTS